MVPQAMAGGRVQAELQAEEALWEDAAAPPVSRAALVSAIGRGDRQLRVRELLLRRTLPNSVDRRGLSALHVA